MRTETKKINIYKFDELEENIQKRLIEKEIQYQSEFYCNYCLKDDMEEEAEILLKKYFKNNATLKNVYFDISYSQGSGAMIEFELTYYNKPITIKQHGYYCHAKSFIIDNDYLLTDKQEEQLKWKIIEMNEELTKIGYNLIKNVETEEEAKEYLQGLEFLSDGSIY